MQRRGRRFEGLRPCAAALLGGLIAASAAPSAALDWQWGELTGRLDSFASVGFSLRTQATKCNRIPNLTGVLSEIPTEEERLAIAEGLGVPALAPFFRMWTFPPPANNPGGCIDPTDIETNTTLLNADDGNLNWDQWDVFSVAFKGSHDLELRWHNLGGFLRASYFIDAIGADAAMPKRTRLAEDSRWRTSVLEGGVVGGQFLLLDAYLFAGFEWAGRYFDFRVGNQVVNWGESTYTQGGINATNTIDVTKIRLPGSDIREALFPAPIVKVGGNIIGALSFEAYYQFAWRQFDLDPPGTFFSVNDMVGRGAQGFFMPFYGDPGATGMTAEEIFAVDPGAVDEETGDPIYVNKATLGLLSPFLGLSPPLEPSDMSWGFFTGAPFAGDKKPSNQGQFGVALRYYFDTIETELGLYYIRHHAKTPSVGFQATELGVGPGRLRYFREYPEDIDLFGLSFNTVLFGMSVGGEVSVRRNEPVPITSAHPDLTYYDLLPPWALELLKILATGELPEGEIDTETPGGTGGVYSGFVREMRLIGIVNGVYVVGPGTPLFGQVLRFIGAQDMRVLAEMGAQWFPDLSETCPPSETRIPLSPEDPKRRSCIAYAAPLGIDKVDKLQISYTIRAEASYDRFLGSPVTLRPVVSFRHDAYGVGPGNGAQWTNGVMQVGASLVADYQKTWQGIVSYSNTFGASQANPFIDRDFLSVSISYTY